MTLQAELKALDKGYNQGIKEERFRISQELIIFIKSIMWCNAHDKGLLEDLITKIKEVTRFKHLTHLRK